MQIISFEAVLLVVFLTGALSGTTNGDRKYATSYTENSYGMAVINSKILLPSTL